MPLLIPQSKLFNLDPLNYKMANQTITTAFNSGEASQKFMDMIAVCYEGQPKEPLKKAQDKFKRNDVIRFASYWCSGGGVEAVLGIGTLLTSFQIADDFRDDVPQNEEINQQMVDPFLHIPSIVGRIWKADRQQLSQGIIELALAAVNEYGLTGNILVDIIRRFLAYGSATCRISADNDDVYDWFVEECRVWSSYSYSIRDKNIKDITLSELMEHRYVEGGCPIVLSAIAACAGISLTKHVLCRDDIKMILKYTSLHACILNDIFSYDREILGPGGQQNFVEYHRIVTSPTQNLEEGIKLTIELCNDLMKKYVALLKEIDLQNEEVLYLTKSAARMVVGNIAWSLQIERYERKEFVAQNISYDESLFIN
eukprot:TRINITY_DN27763_c0_g2_i2.p1 TRINITY_DN27763_c0_g2~~TRINITY_DN27763_c0_g2_i2.p1  ORF type:complete len:369 (-),score=29.63 TRINITY_DN27763_c0_g2_i2:374-1480(-)